MCGRAAFDLCNLDKVVIKSRARTDVSQRLGDGLIHIRSARAELVPPNRQCDCHSALHATRYSSGQLTFSSIVPYAHFVAIANTTAGRVGRIERNEKSQTALP